MKRHTAVSVAEHLLGSTLRSDTFCITLIEGFERIEVLYIAYLPNIISFGDQDFNRNEVMLIIIYYSYNSKTVYIKVSIQYSIPLLFYFSPHA